MKYYQIVLAVMRYLFQISQYILLNMKRIILFMIFFIISSFKVYSQETIWNVKDSNFWTEIEEENSIFEEEKNKKLDAQVELDFSSQKQEIDLIDAINTGLENSSSYKISKYQKQYSDWEFRNKLSEFLPDISYSFSLSDLKGEFLVGGILPRYVHETVYSSTFTTDIEILNIKRVFDSIQLKNQQKSQKHNQNYTKEDLIFRVATAYYELLQKKTEIEIYRYNLIEAEEQNKYNQALYDIGEGTRFDILRSQTEVETAKSDLENALLKQPRQILPILQDIRFFQILFRKIKLFISLNLLKVTKLLIFYFLRLY